MKIALVNPEGYYRNDDDAVVSGMGVYHRGLAKALVEAGHDVVVLVPDWENLHGEPTWTLDGSRVVCLPSGDADTSFAEAVHWYLTQDRVDVVESHQWAGSLFLEQLVGGTPTVVRLASSLLDAAVTGPFIPVDSPLRELLSGRGVKVPERQVSWTRHLIDSATVTGADIVLVAGEKQFKIGQQMGCQRLALIPLGIGSVVEEVKKGEGVLVSVCRYVDPRKGGDLVPSILQQIPKEVPVTVLGEESDPVKQAQLMESAGREANWIFRPVSSQRLLDLYDSHAIVMVPSKSESFGMVYLEPIARGKPVICFDYGDPSKREWPMLRLGAPGPEAIRKMGAALKEAERLVENPKPILDFARKYLWSELVPKYDEAYRMAISVAIARGHVRGW